MTDFQPINDAHAIERVGFVLHLDQEITSEDLEIVRRQHIRWKTDLPAVRPAKGIKLEASPDQELHVIQVPGIEFANLRPDGTPVWSLRWIGSDLSIECSRYTRWAKVWSVARQHMASAIELINEVGRYRPRAVGMAVVDAFIAPEEGDVSRLLAQGVALPSYIFSSGAQWHVHAGRFIGSDDHRLLSNVNVDAVIQSSADDGQVRHRVGITHVLTRDYTGAEGGALPDWIDASMSRFHECNKQALEELLTPAMQSRIGLRRVRK